MRAQVEQKLFYPPSLGCLGSQKLQKLLPSEKTGQGGRFEASEPIWQMSPFPFLPSGAAASLGLEFVFPLGLFL